jgi:hypothetical protein
MSNLIVAVVLVAVVLVAARLAVSQCGCGWPHSARKSNNPWTCSKSQRPTNTLLQEEFVPHNSYSVPNQVSSLVEMDTLAMKAAFNQIMEADAGMFSLAKLAPFRPAAATKEQSDSYVQTVLDRINRIANRRFAVLDVQSVRKETSFDPEDNAIIERYTVNLFVQEHDPRQVSAAAHNISIVFIVRPLTGDMQVTDLHFVTDYYYDGPLVGGRNPYDKFFRILNPFHLQQPFTTSEDKVLPTADAQIAISYAHHKGLQTPRYRCFGANGETQQKCEERDGYWDKPVVADAECPFYQANKNYVNVLGGVHPEGQYCQLPLGMKSVGYRFHSADPAHKPLCYNCRIGKDGSPNSIGPCCDEQRNKELYPNLVTPDYAFPGDGLERGQQWRELGDRGLHWRGQVTTIRNVKDRNQKQPVFGALVGAA